LCAATLSLGVAGCGESKSTSLAAGAGGSAGGAAGTGGVIGGGTAGTAPVDPRRIAQISANGSGTCALRGDGRVFCWADISAIDELVPDVENAVEISTGGTHACARVAEGEVLCWGGNASGQLGIDDEFPGCAIIPTAECAGNATRVPGISNAVQISAGGSHTCARLADRTVVCWGGNDFGQLGDGTTTQRSAPAPVVGFADAVAISAGEYNTCALDARGSVWCWGRDYDHALGIGDTAPDTCEIGPDMIATCARTPVHVMDGAVAVSSGLNGACAIASTGQALCWGWGIGGKVGDGAEESRSLPTEVSGGASFASIDCGYYQSCGITTEGAVLCWGTQSQSPGTTPTLTPTLVPTLESDFLSVSGGWYHSCALRRDNLAFWWQTPLVDPYEVPVP
jgi:alpha-tubulin suppressor-like RCC1 family protein